tara:strand:+ start:91 stop:525 length:435 start_codon:yes stop_codon:yes gene_type:complete
MKKIGEYTIRGTVDQSETARITLFDGRFDTGYRITRIYIGPQSPYGNFDAFLTVKTEDDGVAAESWNWEDNRQIGWASWIADGVGTANTDQNIIDPDNMIVEDLYLSAGANQGGNGTNYLIEMEKYEFEDWDGALAMVRNRSQA